MYTDSIGNDDHTRICYARHIATLILKDDNSMMTMLSDGHEERRLTGSEIFWLIIHGLRLMIDDL